MNRRSDPIDNYLNDITTALPYSDYIKDNVGKYVIVDKKPYLVKGIKFRHTLDTFSTNRILQCFVSVDNTRDDLYLAITLSEQQIYNLMDNPMVLIDLINSHLRQSLKFIPKNKTTDLLFKNEG